MTDFKNKHYIASEAICEICASPVSYLEFREQPVENSFVCKSVKCRRILSHKESNPAKFKSQLRTYKKAIDARQAKIACIDKAGKKEPSENQPVSHPVPETAPGNLERPFHLVHVREGTSTLSSPSEEYLETYKAHVAAIIAEVYSVESPEEASALDIESPDIKNPGLESIEEAEASPEESHENPAFTAIGERVCGSCKGGCCSIGANHAFIKNATIERVREILPEHSAEDMLNEYLSRISDQTMEGSCINHTQTGCSLPTYLRADICNQFFCRDLLKLKGRFDTGTPPDSVLVVKLSSDLWERYCESGENEVTEVLTVQEDNSDSTQ